MDSEAKSDFLPPSIFSRFIYAIFRFAEVERARGTQSEIDGRAIFAPLDTSTRAYLPRLSPMNVDKLAAKLQAYVKLRPRTKLIAQKADRVTFLAPKTRHRLLRCNTPVQLEFLERLEKLADGLISLNGDRRLSRNCQSIVIRCPYSAASGREIRSYFVVPRRRFLEKAKNN